MEGLLAAAGADMAAWHYAKRMRRLNLTGKQQVTRGVGRSMSGWMHGCGNAHCVKPFSTCLPACTPVRALQQQHLQPINPRADPPTCPPACLLCLSQPGSASVQEGLSGFGGAAQSQLTSLLGTTFGQGLSSLTKGALRTLWLRQWHAAVHHARVGMRASIKAPTSLHAAAANGHLPAIQSPVLLTVAAAQHHPSRRREEPAGGGAAGCSHGGHGGAYGWAAQP